MWAVTSYEELGLWNQPPVSLPPRSRLAYLEPVGIGSGMVESLASYSSRLAEIQNVTHASLFGHEISPLIERRHLRNSESRLDRGAILAASFRTLAPAVNGTGITARDYISALETLTKRNDLSCLTMIMWANVIPHRNLLKPFKEWCPHCYEEFRLDKTPVYDPLIWSISVTSFCIVHQSRLHSRCLKCDRQVPQLDSHSKPGFCSKCGSWLGRLTREDNKAPEEIEDQRWITKQISALLASTPHLGVIPTKEALAESIKFCIVKGTGINESRFANSIRVSQSTVNDWQRQGKIPTLQNLLKISHFTQIPLLNILLGQTITYGKHDDAESYQQRQKRGDSAYQQKTRIRIDLEKARATLESSLSKERIPSVQMVALSLNCCATALRKHFPAQCSSLSEKYKQQHKAEWAKVEIALVESLTSNPPQNLRTIAQELHRSLSNLYRYFPDLCRQIKERYERYRNTCRDARKENFCQEIRQIVHRLCQEGIYPSVKNVEAHLLERRTIRHSKLALNTLRQVREECGISTAPNNFMRFTGS